MVISRFLKKYNSISLALKILLLFLFIIIPIYILGTSLYINGRHAIYDEIVSSNQSKVNLYAKNIENEFNAIRKLQYECINDEDILYLANAYEILDNFEKAQYTIRAQNRIEVLAQSNACIDSLYLNIIPINKTITPTRIDPLNQQLIDNYYSSLDSNLIFGINNNNMLTLDIQYTVIPKEGATPILHMNLVISSDKIVDILNGFSIDDNSDLFFICNDRRLVLSKRNDSFLSDFFYNAISNEKESCIKVSDSNKDNLVTYKQLSGYDCYLLLTTPLSKAMISTKHFGIIFFIFTFVSTGLIIVFAFLLKKMVHKPFTVLIDAFSELEEGNLDTQINYSNSDEFNYLYTSFNKTINQLKESIDQIYLQKIQTQRAELKQLQSQINPHFLYNSFFNIKNMAIINDNETLIRFTDYLGKYYRYITRNAKDEVSLKDEIEHAETYLNIQQIRFGNLAVEIEDMPSELDEIMVPRLIIEPIVENAFEHGLKNTSNPKIKISVQKNGNNVAVTISNNGESVAKEKLTSLRIALDDSSAEQETSGIINIHRRLRIRYGLKSGIELWNDDFGFNVKINIVKEDKKICINF